MNHSHMQGGIVNERFYHIYSYSTTICSLLSNTLLIFVLSYTKLSHVGPYRWIILSFAIMDILISLIHSLIFPAIHMTEFGYIFWGYRLLDKPAVVGIFGCMCWVFLFYQSFIILAFHYVYRYVVMCNPPWLDWIRHNPWRNWPLIALSANIIYSVIMCTAVGIGWAPSEQSRDAFAPTMMNTYGIDLYADNQPGFLAQPYWIRRPDDSKDWQWGRLLVMSGAFTTVFGTLGVIGFCLVRILREMGRTKINLESNTRRLQRQLVRALLWQSVIPTVTSYIPICVTVLTPLFFEFSLGGVGTVCIMSMELFPFIDPLIIFFFTGYRASLIRMVRVAVLGPAATTDISPTTTGEQQNGE